MKNIIRNVLLKHMIRWNIKLYGKYINNPPYLDLDKYFPEYKVLEDNWEIIRDEINAIIRNSESIPTLHEIDKGSEFISKNDDKSWNVFVISLYNLWHKHNMKMCPQTLKFLKPMKNVVTIFFSILEPRKIIPPHRGYSKGLIRYQLALKVPKKRNKCQLFVDNKPYSWQEGKSVLFDDTYIHEVKNETDESRIVLYLDIRKTNLKGFLKIYDRLLYRLGQMVILLNRSFKKSKVG